MLRLCVITFFHKIEPEWSPRKPAMNSLLIKDATVVNDGRIQEHDVRIRDGRIDEIGSGLKGSGSETVIEAGGLHLLPGCIDDQVHFREPGLTHKGDIATESAAAVAGGTTSFMDMPNVRPLTVTRKALADKYLLAEGRARANYSFYLGATNENIDEIRAVKPTEACGIKVFMGASTGDMLVDDPDSLAMIFRDSPLLIATHCEDTPIIHANEREYRERYGDEIPLEAHPLIRSAESCYKSSSFAVELAREHDARLHVLHLTTAREMELFSPGPVDGKSITAEVCVHHLYFDESDYKEFGGRIKCNPAIKTKADRQALLQALVSGRIDVIATDHAPHTVEEKQGSYFEISAGLPVVQHALQSVLEHYHRGVLDLELIVEKTSHAVARLFSVEDRGYIREGYWADIVLVDLNKPTRITSDQLLAKCGWSPFEGLEFKSSIITTIVNGQIAYQDNTLTPAIPGQRISHGVGPR